MTIFYIWTVIFYLHFIYISFTFVTIAPASPSCPNVLQGKSNIAPSLFEPGKLPDKLVAPKAWAQSSIKYISFSFEKLFRSEYLPIYQM